MSEELKRCLYCNSKTAVLPCVRCGVLCCCNCAGDMFSGGGVDDYTYLCERCCTEDEEGG